MEAFTNSRLLTVGSEDTLFVSFAFATLLYILVKWQLGPSKHEQARLRDFFRVPQQTFQAAAVPATLQPPDRNICDSLNDAGAVVLWASQGGTAESLAIRYASELSASLDMPVMTADMADYDVKYLTEIPSNKLVVFIASTYGEGSPPDNGVDFLHAVGALRQEGRKLSNMRYVFFGLGNSNYAHFNKFATDVDSALLEMGAIRLGALGAGDDRHGGTEEDFMSWKADTGQSLADAFAFHTAKRQYTPMIHITSREKGEDAVANVYNTEATADMSRTFTLPMTRAEQLVSTNPARKCVHMEFSLEQDPSASYQTGDYVCIWPINPDREVEALLTALDIGETRNTLVDILPLGGTPLTKLHIPTPTTLESLFKYYFDICGPVPRGMILGLTEFITNQDVKNRVEALAGDRDTYFERVTSRKLNLAKVLQLITEDRTDAIEHPQIPLSYILENVKRLQPRSYSISSSAMVEPRSISVTALAVTEPAVRESPIASSFHGLASNYLLQLQEEHIPKRTHSRSATGSSIPGQCGLLQIGKIHGRIRRSSFKPPKDPFTPIIMVGTGTGIAPFRAFVQERMHLKSQGSVVGRTVLVVGHRCPDEDFYYGDLWKEAERVLGDAFELHTAFSRAKNGRRRYVQDVLTVESDTVLEVVGANCSNSGVLYVCGASAMASSVRACLGSIWTRASAEEGSRSQVTAEEWLARLSEQRRFQEDSWG